VSAFEPDETTRLAPARAARENSVETIAGLFAAAALFAGLIALAYHPLPLSVAAVLLALVASGMSTRHRLLCGLAVAVSGLCFVGGMVIAVATNHSLW